MQWKTSRTLNGRTRSPLIFVPYLVRILIDRSWLRDWRRSRRKGNKQTTKGNLSCFSFSRNRICSALIWKRRSLRSNVNWRREKHKWLKYSLRQTWIQQKSLKYVSYFPYNPCIHLHFKVNTKLDEILENKNSRIRYLELNVAQVKKVRTLSCWNKA